MSDLMQQHLTTEETISAKQEFECYAEQHGVRVRHYRCNNGRFADKGFLEEIKRYNQTISFCAVGMHHQNGGAECRIRVITEAAQTMLLHAAHCWRKVIVSNLWLQAIKHAINIRNALPCDNRNKWQISLFSRTTIKPNLKHFHPFGCPVYALEAPLQTHNPFSKWDKCTRVGIVLCHSPHHALLVPLVLNSQTGLVSPQFHCIYNDNFDTVDCDKYAKGLGQYKAKLQEEASSVDNNDWLITDKTLQTRPDIQNYARNNIPEALLQLPDLLRTALTENAEPAHQQQNSAPAQAQTGEEEQQQQPSTSQPAPQAEGETYLVNKAPSGHTRSGRPVQPPQRFSFAALCSSTLHPLATLVTFSGLKMRDPDLIPFEAARSLLKSP